MNKIILSFVLLTSLHAQENQEAQELQQVEQPILTVRQKALKAFIVGGLVIDAINVIKKVLEVAPDTKWFSNQKSSIETVLNHMYETWPLKKYEDKIGSRFIKDKLPLLKQIDDIQTLFDTLECDHVLLVLVMFKANMNKEEVLQENDKFNASCVIDDIKELFYVPTVALPQ